MRRIMSFRVSGWASAMGWTGRLAWALVLCGLGLGALASQAAAASTPPQSALDQAQSELQSLIAAADPSAQADLTDAVSQLGSATAAYLWPDTSDALPPPTGDLVFTDAAAAVGDLGKVRGDPTVPRSRLAAASDEIVDACAELAQAALQRAGLHGGTGGSVSGDRVQYDDAFSALGQEVFDALTSVPRGTIARAAENFLSSPKRFAFGPSPLSGSPLTLDGKPELFYFGAEFCPFCAATRWPMVLALAQFGELSPLALSESSPIDFAPSTNTFTFYGSHYDSSVLSFAPLESWSNRQCTTGSAGCGPFGFTNLQTATESEQEILNQYDANEIFPFLDFGNEWQISGSDTWPLLLQGLSWEQIAAAAGNPGSTVGQYIDGAAELDAGLICEETGERPANICGTSIVRQYQQLLSTSPIAVDGLNPINGVSCFMSSLCAAVDAAGNVLITTDPTANTPAWVSAKIDGSTSVDSVACPSASLCVAVDAAGNALVTQNAAAATPTWSPPANIDGANPFDYVRCPSTSLCVAVDAAGNVVTTDDPSAGTPTWSTPKNIDGTNPLELSCPSTSLCVASDVAGNVLVSDDPGAATPTWSAPQNIDPHGFGDVSCPTTSFCIAVDFAGNAFVTHDADAASATWTGPTNIDGQNLLVGVSCASTALCVATDQNGNVAISDNPAAASPNWIDTNVAASNLTDVACPSKSLCVVVVGQGDALETDNPMAPVPTWNPPGKFLNSSSSLL